jgi:hypothetical protein
VSIGAGEVAHDQLVRKLRAARRHVRHSDESVARLGEDGQVPAVHRKNAVAHEITRGPDDEARSAVVSRGTGPLLSSCRFLFSCYIQHRVLLLNGPAPPAKVGAVQ